MCENKCGTVFPVEELAKAVKELLQPDTPLNIEEVANACEKLSFRVAQTVQGKVISGNITLKEAAQAVYDCLNLETRFTEVETSVTNQGNDISNLQDKTTAQDRAIAELREQSKNDIVDIVTGEDGKLTFKRRSGDITDQFIDTDQLRVIQLNEARNGLIFQNEDGSVLEIEQSQILTLIHSRLKDFVSKPELQSKLEALNFGQVQQLRIVAGDLQIVNEDGSIVGVEISDLIPALNNGLATDAELAATVAGIDTVTVTAGDNVQVQETQTTTGKNYQISADVKFATEEEIDTGGSSNANRAVSAAEYQKEIRIKDRKTQIGYNAGQGATNTSHTVVGNLSGQYNTGIFQSALGEGSGRNNSGNYQTAMGFYAGEDNTGYEQLALGGRAGSKNTGYGQLALGGRAGSKNTGYWQLALGTAAGQENSARYQIALGGRAGSKNTGGYQTAVGAYAGFANTGNEQTAVGSASGSGNIGSDVASLGSDSGMFNSGDHLTAVGARAGSLYSSENLTAIGYSAAGNAEIDNPAVLTIDWNNYNTSDNTLNAPGHGIRLNRRFGASVYSPNDGYKGVKVIATDANTLKFLSPPASGSGFTQLKYGATVNNDYITVIGAYARPRAEDNHTVIGDPNHLNVYTFAAINCSGVVINSDERSKKVGEKVHTMANGIEMYRFTYLPNGKPTTGWLAQQVEELLRSKGFPEDVIEDAVPKKCDVDWQATIKNFNKKLKARISMWPEAQARLDKHVLEIARGLGVTEPTVKEFLLAVEKTQAEYEQALAFNKALAELTPEEGKKLPEPKELIPLTDWQEKTYAELSSYSINNYLVCADDIRGIDKDLVMGLLS